MNDELLAMVEREVLGWEGISKEPGRFSSTVYKLGEREIGHVHRRGVADLSFPELVREELIREGKAVPHHVIPDSPTALCHPLRDERDLSGVLALFRLAYDLAADDGVLHNAMMEMNKPTKGDESES